MTRTTTLAALALALASVAALAGCTGDCSPSCTAGSCGSDGCGGRCACAAGAFCVEESQTCCLPSCDGRECGPDGCGGSCGDCRNDATCNNRTGVCVGGCNPNCDGRACGSDGCGGSCGGCNAPDVCNEGTGQCGGACTPQCGGRACGDDGCGGQCGSCPDGAACQEGACVAGPSCFDLQKNGNESDKDCGGSCEQKCRVGQACGSGGDCTSGTCQSKTCVAAATCGNGGKDPGETDTDCGGPDCAPCPLGKYCLKAQDCLTDSCVFGICERPSCEDQTRNQGETGPDCGGPCEGCPDGERCLDGGDCASGNCLAGWCISCQDGQKNGTETDRDCGGGACPGCADGKACHDGGDCTGSGCEGGACCTTNACGFCGALTDEVCDGKDNDCDGTTDNADWPTQMCPKQIGACFGGRARCAGAAGMVCDDQAYDWNNPAYAPDEKAACDDGVDNDCDAMTDTNDRADCCVPECGDRRCGDDGCGGSCGSCTGQKVCSDEGQCVAGCGSVSDSCIDRCGQDYGTIGNCWCNQSWCDEDPLNCCLDYKGCCGTCVPQCADKECGDDGCGSLCGGCENETVCNDAGRCVPPACGNNPFRTCTGYCGQATSDYGMCTCDAGCGDRGDCCPDYLTCCTDTGPCDADATFRCCDFDTLRHCSGGTLKTADCTLDDLACGWYAGDDTYPANYYCGGSGADPSGNKPRDCTF